jgi:hypothetical protein
MTAAAQKEIASKALALPKEARAASGASTFGITGPARRENLSQGMESALESRIEKEDRGPRQQKGQVDPVGAGQDRIAGEVCHEAIGLVNSKRGRSQRDV